MINCDLIYHSLPSLLYGVSISIFVALFSCSIGIVVGCILGVIQWYGHPLLRSLVAVYVTIIRGTPMLIQIAFAFFVLPHIGITLPAVWIAILAIGSNSSAYVSQIILSGISAVGTGQIEAAQLLGLTRLQIICHIVLPQAIRFTLPALGNEFITLIKDSSLASTIGVTELFKQGQLIISRTYDAISIYTIVALIYLAMTGIIALMLNYGTKRMKKNVSG